jgi:hypothetical protein
MNGDYEARKRCEHTEPQRRTFDSSATGAIALRWAKNPLFCVAVSGDIKQTKSNYLLGKHI